MRIADLPPWERPREKAIKKGVGSLTNAELLALIIGKGTRGRSALEVGTSLLIKFRSLSSIGGAGVTALSELPGVGEAKALILEGMFEIAKRMVLEADYHDPTSPAEIFAHYRLSLFHEVNESLLMILYDRKNGILQEKKLYEGSENRVQISEKGILAEALAAKAHGFLLIHNHPSGVPLPSSGELTLTDRLREKAISLGLDFRDHLIVAGDQYYSFHENGML